MSRPHSPKPTESSHQTKYVLITGGVMSGIGKGICASSTGVLLKSLGMSVTAIKIDPYLNVDAGTMSPFEHGEVYVLDDGGEVDLDLGNYERFLDISLSRDHNITTGKIYDYVIRRERRGDYLGKTVQVVPHVTNAVQEWIERVAKLPVDASRRVPDVCIIELGGTIGDIEQAPFIEAMRQFQFRVGRDNFCSVHVSLVPVVGAVGEQKTKPTQQSVQQLRALGITPDIVVARCGAPVLDETRQKIAMFCHVEPHAVVSCHDVRNTYAVPLLLLSQDMHQLLLRRFALLGSNVPRSWLNPHLEDWKRMADRMDHVLAAAAQNSTAVAAAATPTEGPTVQLAAFASPLPSSMTSSLSASGTSPPAGRDLFSSSLVVSRSIRIALVGKYTDLSDAYLSVLKALQHASLHYETPVTIVWIESVALEAGNEGHDASWEKLKSVEGILVPGGFGDRGIEGKVMAARYAREHKVPYLGICLGMQIAVIEAARHLLGWKKANSEEFRERTSGSGGGCHVPLSPDEKNVVVFMPEIDKEHLGGTMRLGKRRTMFGCVNDENPPSIWRLYGYRSHVDERHRHRYEVDPQSVPELEKVGCRFVGRDETGQRMEVMQLREHPYFVGTQYHPEFMSRPNRPSPPFEGLVLAASGQLEQWLAAHPRPQQQPQQQHQRTKK